MTTAEVTRAGRVAVVVIAILLSAFTLLLASAAPPLLPGVDWLADPVTWALGGATLILAQMLDESEIVTQLFLRAGLAEEVEEA